MNFNGPPPGYNQVIRETNITESSFINENIVSLNILEAES